MEESMKDQIVEVQEELRKFIINNFLFGQEEFALNPEDSFIETGVIDSTGILELVTFIEDKYSFRIEDEEMLPENLDSLERVGNFIIRKQLNTHTVSAKK